MIGPLKVLPILAALVSVGACADTQLDCQEPACIFVRGELSEQHVAALRDAGDALETVYVNSGGGKAGIGAEIGKILLDQDVDLFVSEQCSSACAEYLMTAARSVTAVGTPIIGLHGNSMMRELVYEDQGYDRPAHCRGPSLTVLEEIYVARKLKTDFIHAQYERIGQVDLEYFLDGDGCPLVTRYDTHGRFWYPTTAEFEDLLGLHIEGRLCADEPRCMRRLIH
jgi:hypothetical protein